MGSKEQYSVDGEALHDLRILLEDAIECGDWKCIEDALYIIKDIQGDIEDDLDI